MVHAESSGRFGRVLDAAEAASPVEAVEAVTRELGVALGATVVTFLIADLSGRALIRLVHVPLHHLGESSGSQTLAPGERRDDEESATVLPFDGGPAEQAVRTQTVQVLAPEEPQPGRAGADEWTVLAPVTERGEVIGLLELRLPEEPAHDTVAEIARLAHHLAFVVIANRRHTDLFEWGQRSRRSSLSAEIQQRLLPGPRTCEAGAFTLAAWLEPAAEIAGDTFDYSLARDLLHLSMTDAMGHGVGAALTATLCVGGLRGARRQGASLLEQAASTNAALVENAAESGVDDFVTGVIGRVDLREGTLELVNAGHVAPYLAATGLSGRWTFRRTSPSGCSPRRPTRAPCSHSSPVTGWSSSPTACSSATLPASTSLRRSATPGRCTPVRPYADSPTASCARRGTTSGTMPPSCSSTGMAGTTGSGGLCPAPSRHAPATRWREPWVDSEVDATQDGWVDEELRRWLLEGDPAVRWRVLRHLDGASHQEAERERARVAVTGWGARLLRARDADGGWGGGVYSPKWTSTTYTLLHLLWLGLPPGHPAALRGCELLWQWQGRWRVPETCIVSMLVRLTSYHAYDAPQIDDLVADLLDQQLADGGWNCATRSDKAKHSSFHTSIQALEALDAYADAGGKIDSGQARPRGREFFLRHRLYRSHRTGAVAIRGSTRFPAFPEWHFDVLRGLEHFAAADAPRDDRLGDAVGVLHRARRQDGRWPTYAPYPGRQWFQLEPPGPSRWNTCRALRVLRWWER